MTLVAGVDSSTQSCTVVIRDAEHRRAGPARARPAPRRHGGRPRRLVGRAGRGASTAGRRARRRRGDRRRRPAARHGVPRRARARSSGPRCCGTTRARPRRPPTSSPSWAPQEWADAVGSVPVASFTVTKLRWLAQHEKENAAATAAVCLPHDWLTWRLRAGSDAPGPRRPDHRPLRRQRHRLLVPASRTPTGPTCSSAGSAAPTHAAARARPRRGGRAGRHRAGARPGRRRQRRRRARARAPCRATSWCRSGRPGWRAR